MKWDIVTEEEEEEEEDQILRRRRQEEFRGLKWDSITEEEEDGILVERKTRAVPKTTMGEQFHSSLLVPGMSRSP